MTGWGIGLGLTVVLVSAIWPTFEDMPELADFLGSYPDYMQELFNIEAILTGEGFMNAELFSIILPALFVVFGIGRGARLLAGEEESGVLEAVLVTPVSRTRLLLEKAAALAVAVTVLGVVLFAVLAASSTVFGLEIALSHIAVASLGMVLIGVEHGWLALAVGAVTGRRAVSLAVASAVAVAGYLLHVLGALVEGVRPWQPLSPFTQALAHGPLAGELPLGYLWMALTAIVLLGAAVPVFARRDVTRR